MENLSKDELYLIATKLNVRDLLSMCLSNSKINEKLCQTRDIWVFLLKRDYDFDYTGTKNPKELYLGITNVLYSYYEKDDGTSLNMPKGKTFTQKEITDIFIDMVETGSSPSPIGLYFIAAKYGAIFVMKSVYTTDTFNMYNDGILHEYVMDMDINALEYTLSKSFDLGVASALATVI